ncbi:MAG: FtsX-like permease family protein [Buchnera aphidicola (Meitanaphis microgallis)]
MIYLSLLISKKFSIQFKKNSITPMVTIISKIGIFLGIFVLIVSFSALNGFQFELNNRILSVLPHGEILSINQPFHNWIEIKNSLKVFSEITSIVPYVSTTALIDHINGIKGIQLRGLNFNNNSESNKLYRFINVKTLKKIKNGSNQIILGNNIARSLSIKKGDWINIVVPNKNYSSTLYPKYVSMKVLDYFKVNSSIDNTLAVVPIADLQKYLGMGSNISGLEISIKHPFNGIRVFENVQSNLSNNFIIKNWITEYSHIYHDIKLIKTIIYLTMIFIIIISCFSIASTTLLSISKQINNIAIFKTLGISNHLIRIILLIYGMKSILNVGLLSLLLSIILLLNFKCFIHYIETCFDLKVLSSTVYFIDFIPISISFLDVFLIFCILFLIGLVTSYYPAHYASKIDPAKILKKY